jgi:hypothetical protein
VNPAHVETKDDLWAKYRRLMAVKGSAQGKPAPVGER